jgi:hypothetical protein
MTGIDDGGDGGGRSQGLDADRTRIGRGLDVP